METGSAFRTLETARHLAGVRDVRVLGATGVIEFDHDVDIARATESALETRRVGQALRKLGLLDAAVHLHRQPRSRRSRLQWWLLLRKWHERPQRLEQDAASLGQRLEDRQVALRDRGLERTLRARSSTEHAGRPGGQRLSRART